MDASIAGKFKPCLVGMSILFLMDVSAIAQDEQLLAGAKAEGRVSGTRRRSSISLLVPLRKLLRRNMAFESNTSERIPQLSRFA